MNITWLTNQKRKSSGVEVMITLVGRKTKHVSITFPAGVMATKFGNAERIKVGFDDNKEYMCFQGAEDEGYKVSVLPNKCGRIQVSMGMFEGICEPHEINGNYSLARLEGTKIYYLPINKW